MSYKEPLETLVDIIKTEMSLDNERVLIYNQKWTLPNEKGILVYLSLGNSKVYSNRINYEDREEQGYFEVQDINLRENIIIDILSYDESATQRKWEILAALHSTYAQQKQEEYSFKIASIPSSFVDVSAVEISKRLNRYNLTLGVLSWRTKEKVVDYFDTFGYELKTNV